MRFAGLFRLLVIFAFAISTQMLPANSSGAPKPGSACKKQGATQSHGGKTYSCKKVKGKLVWSTGVQQKSSSGSSSSNAPTASPTSSSSMTSACKLPAVDGRGDVGIGPTNLY